MRYLTREMLSLAALAALMILLGALCLLTLRSKRSSRLYRLKVSILGLIVALWGGGTGCYRETSRGSGDASQKIKRPEGAHPEVAGHDDGFGDPLYEATCYVPVEPDRVPEPVSEPPDESVEADTGEEDGTVENSEEDREEETGEDSEEDSEDEPGV